MRCDATERDGRRVRALCVPGPQGAGLSPELPQNACDRCCSGPAGERRCQTVSMTFDSDGAHRCDGRCVCPEHGTPLFYWPNGDDHACQDPECEYAHGMNDLLTERFAAC